MGYALYSHAAEKGGPTFLWMIPDLATIMWLVLPYFLPGSRNSGVRYLKIKGQDFNIKKISIAIRSV